MADLRERGYTDREINIRLNPLHYMHFREYDMQDFSDDTMLIPYEMACSREMENIQPVCRSWKGSKVYGIIEWIELLP